MISPTLNNKVFSSLDHRDLCHTERYSEALPDPEPDALREPLRDLDREPERDREPDAEREPLPEREREREPECERDRDDRLAGDPEPEREREPRDLVGERLPEWEREPERDRTRLPDLEREPEPLRERDEREGRREDDRRDLLVARDSERGATERDLDRRGDGLRLFDPDRADALDLLVAREAERTDRDLRGERERLRLPDLERDREPDRDRLGDAFLASFVACVLWVSATAGVSSSSSSSSSASLSSTSSSSSPGASNWRSL